MRRFSTRRSCLVIPNRHGTDLGNTDGTEDAHIRIETCSRSGPGICVDRFDSAIEDADEAHIESEFFPHSDVGADEATRYLQSKGFRVAVVIR